MLDKVKSRVTGKVFSITESERGYELIDEEGNKTVITELILNTLYTTDVNNPHKTPQDAIEKIKRKKSIKDLPDDVVNIKPTMPDIPYEEKVCEYVIEGQESAEINGTFEKPRGNHYSGPTPPPNTPKVYTSLKRALWREGFYDRKKKYIRIPRW
jgi:hypothetical protein